jgi:hypothetical protein
MIENSQQDASGMIKVQQRPSAIPQERHKEDVLLVVNDPSFRSRRHPGRMRRSQSTHKRSQRHIRTA